MSSREPRILREKLFERQPSAKRVTMKKPKPNGKKPHSSSKAITVRLEEAIRKADAAKAKAAAAKEALKKARKAFKSARKAAKAARKKMKALQEAFEEAVKKADGKSAVAARKTAEEFRAAAVNASHEPAPARRRTQVKRKRALRPSPVVSIAPLVADEPPAEAVTSPTAVPDDTPSA